jgi:hypothetical protein
MLLEFLLRLRGDGNIGAKHDRPGRRGALIDRKNVRRHDDSPNDFRFDC